MASLNLDEVVSRCKEYSQQMLPRDIHHGFEHILRVRKYALEIGRRENADLWVVEIASYLHDIGRGHEEKGEYHTVTGARLANSFLKSLRLPEREVYRVVHSIECHSRKKAYRKRPETLEAEVLYDADGLDMIGAAGILRIALSAAVINKGWDHIVEKSRWRLSILDDFLTTTGKLMATERRKLVSDFVNQLLNELEET
ncbi:HD domain-containing protein [Candidatus Bathyarchaeota archaeon]|nr:HD domain-containing protein [Candidatus Bathyarchaeota archaeon]